MRSAGSMNRFPRLSRNKLAFPIILVTVVLFVFSLTGQVKTIDRAHAALRLATNLGIQHTNDPAELYGLYPEIFPGGYDGAGDLPFADKVATLETVIVALVRWTGWDTIHYDHQLTAKVKPCLTRGIPILFS